MFPEWRADPKSFDRAMTLSQVVIEGMASSKLTGSLDEAMIEPMLTMLEDQIRTMKPKGG